MPSKASARHGLLDKNGPRKVIHLHGCLGLGVELDVSTGDGGSENLHARYSLVFIEVSMSPDTNLTAALPEPEGNPVSEATTPEGSGPTASLDGSITAPADGPRSEVFPAPESNEQAAAQALGQDPVPEVTGTHQPWCPRPPLPPGATRCPRCNVFQVSRSGPPGYGAAE